MDLSIKRRGGTRHARTATWVALGVAGVAVGRVLASRPADGCPYPPQTLLPPFPRTREETTRRIHARIVEANRALGDPQCAPGSSCAWVVAEALTASVDWRLPPDLVTAIAWQESRFNLHIDNVAQRIAEGREIGPLQVRPIAFRDVGIDPRMLLEVPALQRLHLAVRGGLAYLHRLRAHHLPGASWCSILHAYNVGPSAYRNGTRNQPYVSSVIAQALRYSELR